MLICSVGYAQQKPSKPAKTKKNQRKIAVIPDTTAKPVPSDSLILTDNDTLFFDPLDTVFTVRQSPSALETEVYYTATDSMPYYGDERTTYLYGNAIVKYGKMELRADFIKIEFGKNLITAKGTKDSLGRIRGKPVFKEGDAEYRAETIKYNFKSKKGILSELFTKEGEGFIHGSNVKKDADNNFGIQDAKYTTCEDEHPHFYIGASRIKVIPNKRIITGPANLWIEGVPTILALPFGMFPIKKGQSTGLIIPQYGSSADRGYFLRNGGYYFALGDHHDLQFTGDIYSNTSWASRTLYRYATRYRFNGNFGFNYNYNKFGNEEDPGYYVSKDFQLSWLHRSDPKARPNTNFSANVNVVSSSYLANNSYVAQNIVTNQLNSSIAFSKGSRDGRYNLSTTARMSQNTYTRDISLSLPDITFTISSFAPFKPKYKSTVDKWYENITTNYQLQFRNELITKDSILFRRWDQESSKIPSFLDTANRFGMVHTIPVQTSFKLFKFYTLSASLTFTDYMYYKTIRKEMIGGQLRNTNVFGFENAFTYSPRVGLSTRYYGIAQLKSGPVRAIRHVVTPTIDFTYMPDFGDDRYGYYRQYYTSGTQETTNAQAIRYSIFEGGIVGGPGQGRQGNIGFGLDNNIEMKLAPNPKDSTKTERKVQIFESIRAGAAYNIFADSLNLSLIQVSARTRLFKNIALNAQATIDPYYNAIINSGNYRSIRRINTFYWDHNKTIGTMTNAGMGLSANFTPELFKGKSTRRTSYEGELRYINDFPSDYYDFNIPWSFNINYTVTYYKYQTLNDPTASNYVQTMNFSGDINLTKKWKIGYTSGYDIRNDEITFTSIDFIRDLHCWEFKLNWIPIGPRQSFLFTINVKSSLLQDLKMTRRKDWFDRPI